MLFRSPGSGHRATALVATEHASRYLQQLAKHFAHKLAVTFDATTGQITFPLGTVVMAAGPLGLDLALDCGSADELATLEDVVVRHLVRFAFREELAVAWTAAPTAA